MKVIKPRFTLDEVSWTESPPLPDTEQPVSDNEFANHLAGIRAWSTDPDHTLHQERLRTIMRNVPYTEAQANAVLELFSMEENIEEPAPDSKTTSPQTNLAPPVSIQMLVGDDEVIAALQKLQKTAKNPNLAMFLASINTTLVEMKAALEIDTTPQPPSDNTKPSPAVVSGISNFQIT